MNYGVGKALIQQSRIIPMPVNPYDRAIIVSVYPKEVPSNNVTVFPGKYVIPAAPIDDFSYCLIKPASWFKEMEEGQPFLEIPVSSIQMAESIIKDYAIGLLGSDGSDVMPGLFYIPGGVDRKEYESLESYDKNTRDYILKNHQDKLDLALEKQKRWFKELINMTDVMWARTNGNPRSVSDDARLAVEQLGLKKSWMADFSNIQMVQCKACGHLRNPAFPVCPNCKAIDPNHPGTFNVKFAS